MNRSRSARVGIIGGGIRGGMFARALQENPDAELVAICDRSPVVLTAMIDQLGVPGYSSTEELLAAHPDLTAVVITTPDFAHRDAAVLCARAGLDMMIEKPLATEVGDAQAILDAAEESGSRVMVGFENRWNVRYSAVRDRLGAEGDPRISAQIIHLNDTIFVPTEMLTWSGRSSPAWFLMPHSLDLACWIGRTRPVSVYAVGVRDRLSGVGIDTWDRVNAIFTMADGSHVALNSSWVLPESMPSVFDFRYEIQSAGHVVHIDGSDDGVIDYGTERGQLVQSAVHERAGRIRGVPIDMVSDFVRLVRGEEVDVPDARDGLLITAAIEAVHTALETGQVVEISV